MGQQETTSDEPLTPGARLFLVPEFNQTIICAIGLRDPVTPAFIEIMKSNLANSLISKHPRFNSLFVTDKNGRQYWRRTRVNFDDHMLIRYHYEQSSGESASTDVDSEFFEDIINDYVADLLIASPLSKDKPLWELHLIVDLRCIVWRIHHALGDGISLASMFLEGCRLLSNPDQVPDLLGVRKKKEGHHGRRKEAARLPGIEDLLWLLKVIWFTLIYVAAFIARSLGAKDKKTVISGGDGVEMWPKKIATAKFLLDDMKIAKRGVPNSTINDVLFGIVSSGLSRYLEVRSAQDMQEGQQITGLAMVNLRESKGLQEMSKLMAEGGTTPWGNEFGFVLLPIHYHRTCPGEDPLEHVRRAKQMSDRKKLSLEAYFTHSTCDFLTAFFGPEKTRESNYKVLCNSTFTISNVAGPPEVITIAGNPVTFMKSVATSLPHAVVMYMISYNGVAYMQVCVAKDIIPDPKFLVKCLEDALLEMKTAAEGKSNKSKHA